MADKRISIAVIRRLPKYYRYLEELESQGVKGVSSQELSELTGFTASQIRQDFNNFGGFGQQGFGYNVKSLKQAISDILAHDQVKNAVMVGAGNLGKTIAKYSGFKDCGLNLIGIFDRNPNNIGQELDGIQIQDVKKIEGFLEKKKVDIGIIVVDKESAQDICDILVKHGLKGIWNFAPIDLDVEDDVYVENVSFTESLLVLSYFLNNK
ncbi:redox-sensing transcriptional repressor Rex [Neofamilia massiliensis]|uniref:redox-sensing transcriptional repressor Rex n=1 Tax=Neofamilia massiliensis TaxID=1673724 RepID=UPI0006BB8E9D|nr:redox-sensing transcriptional repressor Rex [Neofamilia massiliensis]